MTMTRMIPTVLKFSAMDGRWGWTLGYDDPAFGTRINIAWGTKEAMERMAKLMNEVEQIINKEASND